MEFRGDFLSFVSNASIEVLNCSWKKVCSNLRIHRNFSRSIGHQTCCTPVLCVGRRINSKWISNLIFNGESEPKQRSCCFLLRDVVTYTYQPIFFIESRINFREERENERMQEKTFI